MLMFRCTACEAEFTEDHVRVVPSTRDEPGYTVCPFCGEQEYEELLSCVDCGEEFSDYEMREGTDMCHKCAEEGGFWV